MQVREVPMDLKLEGKIVLVTGGTSGIGLATAKLFYAEGARVIVTGRNLVTLENARASLHGIAEIVSSDSGDAAAIEDLFAHVAKEYGALDILFLNAGILRGGTIAAMSGADFDEVFRVNVKGPWLALKAAIPLIRRGGAIILNASINARLGMPRHLPRLRQPSARLHGQRRPSSRSKGFASTPSARDPLIRESSRSRGTLPRPPRPRKLGSKPRSHRADSGQPTKSHEWYSFSHPTTRLS
jgi:NAD(P)-dependent dehydrogenase (short-subunit alcohol dehydrogenase family)